jgi:2-keto-4-pentenoate hydratase/2-oxohepta-3-ene-1,7-dioic acid hydratase in catechol pathway
MKLVTVAQGTTRWCGALVDDQVVDLRSVANDLASLIAGGDAALAKARQCLADGKRLPLASLELLAPLPRPARNIFCVGKNYHEHAREFQSSGFDATSGGSDSPELPIIFTKPPSSVIGPGVAIPAHLDTSNSTDYEGELTVVIGEGGRAIAKGDAMRHVYGYTIINDVTARTWQHSHKQWFLGKSLDGFCPMGPCVVTADEVPDPTALRLVTMVNGEPRQNASVRDLIFDIPTLIETISRGITLEPGDLIATGTPVGVGIGFKPPRFLKAGDRVAITIEPIGRLENPVA